MGPPRFELEFPAFRIIVMRDHINLNETPSWKDGPSYPTAPMIIIGVILYLFINLSRYNEILGYEVNMTKGILFPR